MFSTCPPIQQCVELCESVWNCPSLTCDEIYGFLRRWIFGLIETKAEQFNPGRGLLIGFWLNSRKVGFYSGWVTIRMGFYSGGGFMPITCISPDIIHKDRCPGSESDSAIPTPTPVPTTAHDAAIKAHCIVVDASFARGLSWWQRAASQSLL